MGEPPAGGTGRPVFYLGTHHPHWLGRTAVPLFVSRRRLEKRRKTLKAKGVWALDSGGFSELSLSGRWTVGAARYADEARRWQGDIGNMAWAAIMDWMCEPAIIAKTGLSVREHQIRTVASWHELRSIAPDVPWAPVLQGWHHDDYWRHVEDYIAGGVDLMESPVVGVGSICRRQDTAMAEELIRGLSEAGIRVHGFGFKLKGLRAVAPWLASADSMAWSFAARRSPPLAGHPHASCANCMEYALRWGGRVERLIDGACRCRQLQLF